MKSALDKHIDHTVKLPAPRGGANPCLPISLTPRTSLQGCRVQALTEDPPRSAAGASSDPYAPLSLI